MLDAHIINFFACAEALLDDTSGFQVFKAYTYKSTPVAWTDMMKFGHSKQFTVIAYNHAVVKIGCCCCTQVRILLSFLQNNHRLIFPLRLYLYASNPERSSVSSTNFAKPFFFRFSRNNHVTSAPLPAAHSP